MVVSVAATTVLVVAVLVALAPILTFVEVRAYDCVQTYLVPTRRPDPRVVLLDTGSDSRAYDKYRVPGDDPEQGGCAIPRRAYAEAVRRLSRWGAKAIVLDMYFPRPCPFEDRELSKAFADAGNVIVSATTKVNPDAVGLSPPSGDLAESVWATGAPYSHTPNETVRSVSLVVTDRDTGDRYSALSLLGFQRFMGVPASDMKLEEGRWLFTAEQRIPLRAGEQISLLPLGKPRSGDGGGSAMAAVEVVRGDNVKEIAQAKSWNVFLINWVGPEGTFNPEPLPNVLVMSDREGRAAFDGRAVVIGNMDWDEHWTSVKTMPGPEIQANALNTLISGQFIRPMSPWAFLGVLAAFVCLTTLIVRPLKSMRSGFGVLLLMGIAVLVARDLMVRRGTWLYLSYCEFGILLSWGVTTATQSRKVVTLLGRFAPAFLGRPATDGIEEVRTQEATCLYSDIRSYTTISEQLAAEDMLRLLISYRSSVEDIIARHRGTIIKTPGDAILAVFLGEHRGVNHAEAAVEAGREILANLPALRPIWEEAGAELRLGIGINSGPIAMGYVGKRHVEPTVIGDAVNVSQRLETLTKTLGYPLIFSETVREQLREGTEAVCLDEVSVQGRQEPVKIYGLAGPEGFGQPPQPDANPDSAE